MAIDRGGLQYTISVRDEFSKATTKFRTEVDSMRASFASFKKETEGLAATNSRITVTLNESAAASARKTRQISAEEEAERKLTRILRDRIVQENLSDLAKEKGVTLSKRKARQLTVEQEAERKLIKQTRQTAVARKVEELAQQRGVDLSRRRVKLLSVEEEAQRRVEAVVRRRAVAAKTALLAEQAGIDLSKKKVKQLSVEEEALARVVKAERARSIAARVAQLQQERFIGPQVPADFQPTAKTPAPGDKETLKGLALARQRVDAFRSALAQTNAGGNDILFTFRRLFGVLAAFQAARAIFTSFVDFIKTGIEFNATIERTRLGIASLIIAVGQVRDAQGQTLDEGEAFLAAQKEAVRQQRLLRAESLKTTATFEELLDTFQTAVGPGVAAGLDLNQIREFSIRISQAASAIGVAQNQLSEEIRSILSGTIQQRTTRIAAVLQISNEDIRNAREAGRLFEFLQERFKTFGIAGEEAGKTFEGLTSILKGAIQELAGIAAAPLFEALKETLKDLIDLILTIGPDGAIIINPDAVKAVAPIFQGILVAIEAIKQSARGLGFDDIASSAKLIGGALALAGTVIGGIVQGIAEGFRVVVGIIDSILAQFDTQGLSLQELIALVTKYTTIFGTGVAVAGLLGFALNALLSPFKQLITLASTLLTSVLNIVSAVLKLPPAILQSLGTAAALLAVFLTLGELVRQLTESVFDVNLSFKDTIELISLGFIGGIVDAVNVIRELAMAIRFQIGEAFTSASESALKFVNEAKTYLASLVGDNKEAEQLAAEQLQTELDNDRARFIRRKKYEVELADFRAQTEAKSLAINNEIATIVGQAAGKDALGKIPTLFEEILGGLGSLIGGFDLGFSKLGEGGAFSLDKLLDLPGFIERLNKALAEAGQQDAAPINLEARGVALTDEQRQDLADAQQKLEITRQQIEAQQALNELEGRRAGANSIRLQTLINEANELQTQLDTQRAINEIELERAQKAIGGAQGEEQRVFLLEQFQTLKAQQIADEDLLAAKIRAVNIELERQRQIVEGTVNEGFTQGLSDFAEQFGSAFQAGINIAQGLLTSFSSFVSDSLVEAFDPNNDTSIKERFGKFLQDLARLILNEIIKLQIAKALVGFGFADGGEVGNGGRSVGRAKGGSIPRRAAASYGHYGIGVKGLAAGGQATPPPGVDRRDTVPIWAQPGEFMQSLAAVRTYGRDFMAALNARVLDPNALRSLAGLGGSRRIARAAHRGPGFVTGGEIPNQVARQAASQGFGGGQAQGPAIQQAVVVAGEAAFDKLVAGGSGSLLRFMRENRDTISGILGR